MTTVTRCGDISIKRKILKATLAGIFVVNPGVNNNYLPNLVATKMVKIMRKQIIKNIFVAIIF